MRDYKLKFEESKIDVKLVTFEPVDRVAEYVEQFSIEWPVLIDEEKVAYQQFGFGRASSWTLLNPMSCLRYIGLMIRGKMPGKPGGDLHQLGGDVLVDDAGYIRYYVASQTPFDRPSPSEILTMVQSQVENTRRHMPRQDDDEEKATAFRRRRALAGGCDSHCTVRADTSWPV